VSATVAGSRARRARSPVLKHQCEPYGR